MDVLNVEEIVQFVCVCTAIGQGRVKGQGRIKSKKDMKETNEQFYNMMQMVTNTIIKMKRRKSMSRWFSRLLFSCELGLPQKAFWGNAAVCKKGGKIA